ncbi:geranylgeranyl transferase type-2 subunit alpha-like protein, partial [Leptotrombidium deliense]
MHGRLKVKTTAEKEREKRLEKEEKCKLFKAGIDKAFEMRKKNDNENALSVTAPLLMANPDVYTLWNYRREVFLQRRDLLNQISEDLSLQQAEPELTQESFEELCSKELDLTSTCLLKNPKSYCVWHHRYWILQIMKNPNWKREIQLCNEFLEMDERNFHCWDFRRFVCHSENIPIEEELDFSLKKVEENFSNFSSWFYRSSLFTEAHTRKIIDFTGFWNDEYSMVESALFTDPSDQSPWFYHKWLLATNYGKNISSFSTTNENFKVTIENIIYDVTSGILAVVFNKSIRKCQYLVSFKDDSFEHNVQEKSWFSTNEPFSKTWYIFTSFHKSCDVVILTLDASMNDPFLVGLPDTIECKRMKGNDKFTMNSINCEHLLSEEKIKSLRCLQAMEPMNKWINLVLTAIDDKQPKENAK